MVKPVVFAACLLVALTTSRVHGQSPRDRALQAQELITAGRVKEAEPLLASAVQQALKSDPDNVALCACFWAYSLGLQSKYEQEEAMLTQTLDWCRKTNRADDVHVAGLIAELAACRLHFGDLTQAEKHCQQAIAMLKRHVQSDDTYLLNEWIRLANIYKHQARFDEARKLLERVLPLTRKPGEVYESTRVGVYLELAEVALKQARYDVAEPYYRTVLEYNVHRYGRDHVVTGEAAGNLAACISIQNRFAEATPYLEWALENARRHIPGSFKEGLALVNLGTNYSSMNQYDASAHCLEEACRIFERSYPADHPNLCFAYSNLAVTYSNMGRLDEAESFYRRAVAGMRKSLGEHHTAVAHVDGRLALLLTMQKKHGEAAELIERAIKIQQDTAADLGELSDCFRCRAEIRWATGQPQQAFDDVEQAMRLADQQRGRSAGAERERATLFGHYARAFEDAVRWRLEKQDVAQAMLAMERGRARSFLDELSTANVDLTHGRSVEQRRAIETQEAELRTAITRIERQLEQLSATQTAEQRLESETLSEQLRYARHALYEHFRELRASSSLYRELLTTDQGVPNLEQIKRQLAGGDNLVLAYLMGVEGSYVIAINGEGASGSLLSLTENQAASLGVPAGPLTASRLVRALMTEQGDGIMQRLSDRATSDTANDQLAALWQALIPETQRQLLVAGKYRRLIVLPSAPLLVLPFEALVVEQGKETRYLLDAGPPIVYAPSAAVLTNLLARAPKFSAAEPVLTLGDPTYKSAQSAATNRARVRLNLARLPYSGQESKWIAQLFNQAKLPATQLLAAQATEGNVRRLVIGRRIVHLACHGASDEAYDNFYGALALAPGANPADPNDDGVLSLPEIYQLNLGSCELAILSACMTNYGPQQAGEGSWPVSRAFLVAGAKRVVASNWTVDDEAGASLISFFCGGLAKSLASDKHDEYAQRLWEAKRWTRGQRKWQSPYYWASFELVGPP